jgi:hypothetical protein
MGAQLSDSLRRHIFFAFARARRMEAVPLHRSEQYNGWAPRDCAAWMRFSGMGVEQTAHLGLMRAPRRPFSVLVKVASAFSICLGITLYARDVKGYTESF